MSHAPKLRLRIFEIRHRASCFAREISHIIVGRISRSFRAGQNRLAFIVERRDHRLVGLCVAAEQTRCLECLQIQTIDEWTIAFG